MSSSTVQTQTLQTPQLAKVIPFRPRKVITPSSTVIAPLVSNAPQVTQERLLKGKQLLEQEWAAIRAARQYLLELENDLLSGSDVEAGELVFDQALKMVRPLAGSQPKTASSGV